MDNDEFLGINLWVISMLYGNRMKFHPEGLEKDYLNPYWEWLETVPTNPRVLLFRLFWSGCDFRLYVYDMENKILVNKDVKSLSDILTTQSEIRKLLVELKDF